MSEKWTRYGRGVRNSVDGAWCIDLGNGNRDDMPGVARIVNELLADANYGAAIRKFVEAAKPILQLFNRMPLYDETLPIPVAYFNALFGKPLLPEVERALGLLPAPDPPKATLAEQGEEIKASLDLVVHNPRSRERVKAEIDALVKAAVDALVAGKGSE